MPKTYILDYPKAVASAGLSVDDKLSNKSSKQNGVGAYRVMKKLREVLIKKGYNCYFESTGLDPSDCIFIVPIISKFQNKKNN